MDPTLSNHRMPVTCGFPVGVLSSDLCGCFRASLRQMPTWRTPAITWVDVIDGAINQLHECPVCSCPNIIDSSKTGCPHCQTPFPIFTLLVKSTGKQIRLDRAAVLLGRSELADSPWVSKRHAIVRRHGPRAWLEPRGQNGTDRFNGQSWDRLPNWVPVLIRPHELLRFGDVEVEVL